MSNYARKQRLRDLDLAQMHLWPDAPRRWTIALLAAGVMAFAVIYFVWPLYERLKQASAQIGVLQSQIVRANQIPVQTLGDAATVRQIKRVEQSDWLTHIAAVAKNNQLESVSVKEHDLEEAERNKLRDYTKVMIKSNPRLQRNSTDNLPQNWLNQVAWVNIEVQGKYSDVLTFVSQIGAQDEWLGISEVQINAIDQNNVKWQGGLWYYKEAVQYGK